MDILLNLREAGALCKTSGIGPFPRPARQASLAPAELAAELAAESAAEFAAELAAELGRFRGRFRGRFVRVRASWREFARVGASSREEHHWHPL